MIGAITGDIAGSRFEWHNIKTKDFELFTDKCFFTDDSVMTIAVADALMRADGNIDILPEYTIESMQLIGRPYPNCGYGGFFYRWMYSDNPMPYGSYGNGAAMRVSACGFVAKSLEEAKALSEAVTAAIYLARSGYSAQEIQQHINDNYYSMDFTLDEIRGTYKFNETCQNTVPQALKAFFESDSFEDAIRNAISIGGDSDTLAAITGGIAEVYYGVPQDIKEKALKYLDKNLLEIVNIFYCKV